MDIMIIVGDLGNTETKLFSNVNLKGSGFPDVIQVVITDFKEGDVLRINNDDVDQSFDTGSGVLTLSNPLGADNSSKIIDNRSSKRFSITFFEKPNCI